MSAKFVFLGIGIFAAGVGAGVGGTLLYQRYFWELDDEEDEEEESEEEEETEAECEKPKQTLDPLRDQMKKEVEEERKDYRQYHERAAKYKPAPEPEEDDSEPMLITQDEFETAIGYESEQMFLYTNGIVTDVDDCPIRNPGALFGAEFMKYFDDGDEVVYIRNPRNRTEYELELVNAPFSEVSGNGGRG